MQFLQQNAIMLFLCFIHVLIATAVVVAGVRSRLYGIVFPPLDPNRVLYRDNWATGISHPPLWTRHKPGGLPVRVAVTDDEIRVWLPFPLSIFRCENDFEHRIPRTTITGFEEQARGGSRTWIIDYEDHEGRPRRTELYVRRPVEFLKALNEKPTSTHVETDRDHAY